MASSDVNSGQPWVSLVKDDQRRKKFAALRIRHGDARFVGPGIKKAGTKSEPLSTVPGGLVWARATRLGTVLGSGIRPVDPYWKKVVARGGAVASFRGLRAGTKND